MEFLDFCCNIFASYNNNLTSMIWKWTEKLFSEKVTISVPAATYYNYNNFPVRSKAATEK